MNESIHERAKRLILERRVEGLSAGDQEWLEQHLDACAGCAAQAQSVEQCVGSLKSLRAELDPAVIQAARRRVRLRAGEIQAQRARLSPVWVALVVSGAWTLLLTPYLWRGFEWVGRSFRLADGVWATAFLVWWFLPATAIAAVLAWRRLGKMEGTQNGFAA